MHHIIGSIAGEIWRYLEVNGTSTVIKLKSGVGVPNSILYLAIGWLSREGQINISEYGHTFKVSIKNSK